MRHVRIGSVLVAAVVLHLVVGGWFRPGGIHPDLILLVAAAAGLAGGAERGTAAGFVAGLLGDLFLETPFGLTALVACLVGFGVGLVQGGILKAAWWIGPLTIFGASAAGAVAYGVAGAVVGRAHFVEPRLALIAVVVATVNAVLALPALRATRWAYADSRVERAFL